ncbi:hypothetical protein TTHERM_000535321 (macronuclear) [Tetrahymena thermophila SB210]|uniref:Uncharacterized protein n=1 Tax=Tetrahymena thermophila (strain SB210) TaxID=312017 RepID=W7X731_TETTS|nr:hypothetical protein TTHERM_000535321 [Tetrahymena thermophila SB210]EWS72203.1 hypothetical protein TTHERM_000535321 [Tetrahymena thermophila SB210]|eukprot:XP_012655246.1 hypothetical protein TTHERM_000535321 [Tetrahymena thermophila SB210]
MGKKDINQFIIYGYQLMSQQLQKRERVLRAWQKKRKDAYLWIKGLWLFQEMKQGKNTDSQSSEY